MPKATASDYIREEIHHIRDGEHGARSTKQAIAIGLSKARRAGVKVKTPKTASAAVRKQAKRETAKGRLHKRPSPTRSKAALHALEHEPHTAASHAALSKHAHEVAKRRGHAAMSRSAKQAARTRKRG